MAGAEFTRPSDRKVKEIVVGQSKEYTVADQAISFSVPPEELEDQKVVSGYTTGVVREVSANRVWRGGTTG